MRPVTLTTTDASSVAKTSNYYRVCHAQVPANIGFAVVVTGTVSYTVQHTFDDPDSASPVWFDHDDVASETTNQDGNYAFPCVAIRLRQASGSGSCRMVLSQAG